MSRLFNGASRLALIVALPALTLSPAMAADFTVSGTDTEAKTVSGADRGLIEKGATLDTTNTAITQSGASTGVVIDNLGTLNAGSRGLDVTGGNATRNVTLNNQGLIETSNDAFRVNTNVTSGTIRLDNEGTMRSATGQVLDFANMQAGSAIVDIDNSGTMEALDNDAIVLGGGTISIRNSGRILSTTSESRAIEVNEEDADITSFDLYNAEGGLISSTDDAIRIGDEPTVGTVRVENHGQISSVSGQALDFNNIRATSVHILNYGVIDTQDADAIRAGQGGVVENWGEIHGRAIDPNGSSDGIDFQETNKGEVINRDGGIITGTRHGITGKVSMTITNEAGGLIQGFNGSGINYDTLPGGEPMKVVNHGTIVGSFNPDAEYGDGDGIDIDAIGHIYNYGVIRGEGSNGTKEDDLYPATSEAIAIGGGLIFNGSADYRNALISGVDNGILVDDSETGDAFAAIEIVNWGRIEGLDGYGIRIISSDANTIENFGTIAGANGIAVDFGAGDDLFVHHAGSTVEGYVDGRDGTDEFRLGTGTGSFDLGELADDGTYRNFENFGIANGYWTLSGASDIAGTSTFEDSLVVLDGAKLSNSAVSLTDTLLRGDGTIGGLNATNSVVELSPSEGGTATLHAMGDVSFDATSALAVSLRGASVDALTTDGTMTIAEGATLILGGSGSGCIVTECIVMSAADGFTGTFTLDNRLVFLDAEVDYQAQNAYLELERNSTTFASVGQTGNQQSVGDALDRMLDDGALPIEISGMTAEQARAAYNQISGDGYASSASVAATQTLDFTDRLLDRMHDRRPMTAPQAAPSAYGPGLDGFETPAGRAWNAWAMAMGNRTDIDGNGNAAGLRSNSGGFAGGVDAAFGDNLLGFATSYTTSSTKADGVDSEIDADTVRIAAYGAHRMGAFQLSGGASFGWSSYDSERHLTLGGIDETAKADYDGYSGSLFGELSYDVNMQGVRLQPFGNLTVTRVKTDAFTETGAPMAGLSVDEITETYTFSQLGMRFATAVQVDGAVLVPTAKLGWRHAFDADPVAAAMQLPGGADFVVDGLPIAEDSLSIGAGLEAHLTSGTSLGVNYSGDFGNDASQHTGQAFFRFAF